MTESVDFMDGYLDPPDPPTHRKCDKCGETVPVDDLNPRYYKWICNGCIDEYDAIFEDK